MINAYFDTLYYNKYCLNYIITLVKIRLINSAKNIYSIWARKHLAGPMEILAVVPAKKKPYFWALFLHRGPEPDVMISEYVSGCWMPVRVFSSAAFNVLSRFKLGKKELVCLWVIIFLNGTKNHNASLTKHVVKTIQNLCVVMYLCRIQTDDPSYVTWISAPQASGGTNTHLFFLFWNSCAFGHPSVCYLMS